MVTTSITTESILAYQAYLHSEERSASTIENYLRHVRAFAAWLGDRSIDKTRMEAEPACARLRPNHHQRHAGSAAQLFPLPRLGASPRALSARAATLVSRRRTRTQPRRIPAIVAHSTRTSYASACSHHRNPWRHRHPCFRALRHHRRSCAEQARRHPSQRQDPHHPHPIKAQQKTDFLRPRTKNHPR